MYACQQCKAGTYSIALGANSSSTCLVCLPGSYSGMGKAACDVCNAGFVLQKS